MPPMIGLRVGQPHRPLLPSLLIRIRHAVLQVSSKFAAVLVPLFEDPSSGEVHVVLNQRSSKLKTHSGEGGEQGGGCGRRERVIMCPENVHWREAGQAGGWS